MDTSAVSRRFSVPPDKCVLSLPSHNPAGIQQPVPVLSGFADTDIPDMDIHILPLHRTRFGFAGLYLSRMECTFTLSELFLCPELQLIQMGVQTAARQQLRMRALLGNAAVGNHSDLIGVFDGG